MKRFIQFPFLIVFFLSETCCPVGFVQQIRSAPGAAVATLSLTLSPATTNNNFIFVGIMINDSTTAHTVSSVVDNAGNVYQKYGDSGTISTSANRRTEIWGSPSTISASSMTVNLSGASTEMAFFFGEYNNVSGVGVASNNSGSSTNPNLSITTNRNNDFIVCQSVENNNSSITANSGAIRNSRTTTTFGGAYIDNTTVNPSSLQCSTTIGSTSAWSIAGMDLLSRNPLFMINGGQVTIQ